MMLRRALLALGLCLSGLLLSAPAALAADGEGLYGKTTDLAVTLFCFGVMIFFTLFVIGMSLLQGRLESRKERVRDEIERLRQP